MMHMRGYQSGTNPDVAIIIPSTGRAEQCARLVERIRETARTGPSITVSVEPDDVEPYRNALSALPPGESWLTHLHLVHADPVRMSTISALNVLPGHVAAINRAALACVPPLNFESLGIALKLPKIIIKLDDDHWPVTPGWDRLYLNALDALGGTGVVYGNDLHQGERLPTVPGLSADIVRELGWYAPPQLGHLFCDNYWLELGRRSGRLSYMPDVIIEHRHPDAGKASNDDTYQQGGRNEGRWSADEREWEKIIAPNARWANVIEYVELAGSATLTGAAPSQMDIWAGAVREMAERGSSR